MSFFLTIGTIALAAGGSNAALQSAAATAGITQDTDSQKSASRGGARSHGSG